ncbi:large conductance mechanosensitive channel protein MscL [Gordonia rhizosphera]|uniref:Large-conductance mechanosensitive channel n=1 Tax=Gordonia rhizosphera NBRC 16068 TaxID=1108045 RepID=K6VB97_9ACTN|nr:large conductance mechanosensitive channel protein MscL [Gordonia rhizosphera]GAB93488.1 large-conductance mechanosensitive channel [Gordonia rhizosphera NBRC 16068]
MLKGFRDFILRGNVVELATAVIIGAAFTAIVTAFTEKIIQPLINAIPIGSDAAEGLGFQVTDNPSTFVDIGALITAIINFLIVAAVVYFIIIVPYNRLAELGGFGKKAEVSEVSLLTEIRDLLDPEGRSKAKEEAEKDLPAHLREPAETPPGSGDPGLTQRLTTPPPADTYQMGQRPPSAPPSGGAPYATPQPAPGSYPPPGNYPPGSYPPGGSYPPPGQYPGEYPPSDSPGRHSR